MKEEVRIFLMSGLLEEYAMGLTSQEQNQDIEKYIAEYEEVRTAYENVQLEMERYAKSIAEQPPSGLRDKIVPNSVSPLTPSMGTLGWAATILLFASMGWVYSLYQDVDALRQMNQNAAAEFQIALDSCSRMQTRTNQFAFIQHEKTHSWDIHGNEKAPDITLTAFWNPSSKEGHLMIKQLPEAPIGHCYQIWADVKGEMIPVGILRASEKWMQLNYLENIESLNVTIEKEGGADHPNVAQLVANVQVEVS